MFALAGFLLALSGAAALTYQVVWVRLLSLLFGSSSESVSTVLAAFFLGLALGSAAALRLARGRNLLVVYAGLELLIGAWGGLLLLLLPRLGHVVAWLGASHVAVKFVVSFALLLPPTVAMGATLPLLAAAVIHDRTAMGRGIGGLYAANTAGAWGGVLWSGFVFIPRLGLDGATFVAIALNLAAAVLAWARRRRAAVSFVDARDESTAAPVTRGRRAALVIVCCTGFAAIAAEVGWTKYLVLFTGGTVFGYSLILSVFLAGIALGSWATRALSSRIGSPVRWLSAGVMALALSLLLSRQLLTVLPTSLAQLNQTEPTAALRLMVQLGFVGAALVPPTFLFGAVFPLTLTIICHDVAGMRGRLGGAYALNTVASVAGSLCAGFWILPQFGTDALLAALGAGLAVVGLAVLAPLVPSRSWRMGLAGSAAGAVLLAAVGPRLRYEPLIAAVDFVYTQESGEARSPSRFLFLEEGKTGVVSLSTHGEGRLRLQNNGLVESVLDRTDPDAGSRVETLLGMVPYLIHPRPRTAFVVGFGGGTTARALLRTDLEAVRVVELEPAVVRAVRTVFDPRAAGLSDPRLRLVYEDARFDLLVHDATYDLVVAQPSHPWLAGASAVFSREYFELVRSRLNEGGICGQWINLFNMDRTTLLSIGRAFFEVFPHGFTLALHPPRDLLLFGSTSPLRISAATVEAKLAAMRDVITFQAMQLESAVDLLKSFALSRAQMLSLAEGIAATDDLNILSEVRLASLDLRRYKALEPEENPRVLLEKNLRYDFTGLELEGTRLEILDRIAIRLIANDDRMRARRVLEEMMSLDPDRARALQRQLDAGGRARAERFAP